MYKRVILFDLPLDLGVEMQDIMSGVSAGKLLMTYLNPYAYSVARRFTDYAANLQRFDLVVCDGIGVQIAAKTVFQHSTKVISPSLPGSVQVILNLGATQGYSLCLVGATAEAVEKTALFIDREFAGFKRVSWFSGYGDSPKRARDHILASETDMVLVGLGMGLQEKFLLELSDAGWKGVGSCVGGTIDQIAHPEIAYPAWSDRLHLRFLGRLLREPRRLSRRYFIDYQVFIGRYLKYLVLRR